MELQVLRANSNLESDLRLKVVLLGGPQVGKSNIMSKLGYNRFGLGTQSTIGVEYCQFSVNHKTHSFKLQIWDTEYTPTFANIPEPFYRNIIGRSVITRCAASL